MAEIVADAAGQAAEDTRCTDLRGPTHRKATTSVVAFLCIVLRPVRRETKGVYQKAHGNKGLIYFSPGTRNALVNRLEIEYCPSERPTTVGNNMIETPFDNIEGAHEYLGLLAEAVDEARHTADTDILAEGGAKSQRRLDALRLVLYKLEKLEQHIKISRRLLNDLRSMRRLLLDERAEPATSTREAELKL